MTDYPEYERQQELASQGDHVAKCMSAILDAVGPASRSLASLQARVYKDTGPGITISFQLGDGSYVWAGDLRARDEALVTRVRRIGFSSIVEGTDREVELRWLDLLDESFKSPADCVYEFERLVELTDQEALTIWHEEHNDPSFC